MTRRVLVAVLLTLTVIVLWAWAGGDPVNNESGNNAPPDTYTTHTLGGN